MARKLIDEKGLEAKGIKASRWTLLRLEKKRLFPQRVRPTPGTIAWIEDEVDAHLARIAAERDGAPEAA